MWKNGRAECAEVFVGSVSELGAVAYTALFNCYAGHSLLLRHKACARLVTVSSSNRHRGIRCCPAAFE